MSYITIPITVNPSALVEEANAEMETLVEGWEPSPGNIETFIFLAVAYRLIQPLAELAADVPDEIFYAYGQKVVNVQPHLATYATAGSTWTVKDTAGYTIPAGTQVEVLVSGDESVGFVVVFDVVILPGASKTAAGEVLLEAIEPGTAANELEGELVLIDALGFVTELELAEATGGGEDAEESSDYLDRLAEAMEALAPRPIIATDVAILARQLPGIQRALVLDNYNDLTAEGELEKTTSVYPVDADGLPVTAGVKEDLDDTLQAKREINYVFVVADPDYTEFLVKCNAVAEAGQDTATIKARLEAAIAEFLDPARWGAAPEQTAGDPPRTWVDTKTLRFQDLVTVVNNVQGLSHYTLLEVKKEGGAYGTSDVTLNGVACLPKLKTQTIAVS